VVDWSISTTGLHLEVHLGSSVSSTTLFVVWMVILVGKVRLYSALMVGVGAVLDKTQEEMRGSRERLDVARCKR
jgi:hypothetical protein